MHCGHHCEYHHGPPGYLCPHCGYHYGPPGYLCPHCGLPHPPPSWYGWPPPPPPPYRWGHAPGWAPPGPYAWPAPPRPMTDEEIRTQASDSLRGDPRIPPQAQIQVEVRGGVVTLTGSVPDKWVKHAASEVALGLPGVVDVQNNLQVARPGGPGAEGGPTART